MTIATEMGEESLAGAMGRVYNLLLSRTGEAPQPGGSAVSSAPPDAPGAGVPDWPPFEILTKLFGLSPFERDVLVLCAGPSLDTRFGPAMTGRTGGQWPTFGLALSVLDHPHWSAITPAGPLRYWQLVDVGRGPLLDASLHLEERILQFAVGVPALDERLQPLVHPMPASTAEGLGRDRVVEAAVRHWASASRPAEPLLLIGKQRAAQEATFAQICQELGLQPYWMEAGAIPADATERERLARLWAREARLSGAALYLRTEYGEDRRAISTWLGTASALTAVEVRPGTAAEQLEGLRLHVSSISVDERRQLWQKELGPLAAGMNGHLDRISEYFDFDERTVRLIAAQLIQSTSGGGAESAAVTCWSACREHGRRSLESLAQRVEARATWDDIVVPAPQLETLRQVAMHVRQRAMVNDRWGFRSKHARGLGLTVMFSGASGTGKTMAAEILAGELDLDLYRVDLASVVSKYIGETEKNLRAIFDGADSSGAMLLFDEADALFGKRSEVRDSHDRYANLEISYLLQQMEAYRGVAILTTNMQQAVDHAFTRRLRFIVQFPFPDTAARARIWRGIFPTATPLGSLDFDQLAQLNVPGGVIRNIATNAAFLAADAGESIQTKHILAAARTEYSKMDKPLTEPETRGLS
jgi:hypothetical protein